MHVVTTGVDGLITIARRDGSFDEPVGNGHVCATRITPAKLHPFSKQQAGKQTNEQTNKRTNEMRAIHSVLVRCFRKRQAMAEERKASRTRHRGAAAVQTAIAPVRRASQYQMVSWLDPYLHFQRERRNNARQRRHGR